ncbi:unnamed protein product [Pieris brassicae]|uniref:Uncharacterized protein n=1 Tax=Pieris brassicae TaxID=7116 RepID=A0A9P0TNA6_PIEBR|nr:unnamed protein product [Pieris brassicae]
MNQIKTGGGPADFIPPDDILDRVTGMLGSTASGFTVPFGGDREKVGLDVGMLMGGDGGKRDVDATVAVELTEVVNLMPMSTGWYADCVRKKFKQDDCRTEKNKSIAEYDSAKKICLEATLDNFILENEHYK